MTILSKKFLRRSVRKLSLLLLRFQCQLYNLLLLKWQLLGVEMKLGQAHKTRFWYRSRCSRNFPTSTPITFIGEYPRGSKPPPPPHNNRHPDFPRVPLLASVKAKSGFFFSLLDKNLHYSQKKRIFTSHHSDYLALQIYTVEHHMRPVPISDHLPQATTNPPPI